MGAARPECLPVFVLVLILGLGEWGEGCWEQEKLGLLQLKPFFNLQPDLLNIYYQYALYDWVEEEGKESSDCCKWERVECDATTGRVIGLSLANRLVEDTFLIHKTDIETRQWYLNASLFLPFEELKSLSLSGNQIAGCLDNEGFEKLALKLKKLKFLDLSFNNFDDRSILSSLVEFSSLKSLNLSYNQLSEPNHTNVGLGGLSMRLSPIEIIDLQGNQLNENILVSLSEISSIKYLDLSSNYITAESIQSASFKGLSRLRSLETLNLSNNNLNNSILSHLGDLSSLKTLALQNCGLNGTIYIQDICQLRFLEKLVIKQNILRGVLPVCISNLTSLKYLDISSNQISGNLAKSPLQSLTSIEYIDLSNNQFQIPSSLKSFFNHSKLKYFHGDNNDIYAETELHSLTPRFQLKAISLSCCGDVGPLPEFLFHQHELQSVDLSNINLTGEFPSWLLGNNTELERLFLINNSFSGNFRLPFHSPMKLLELDISKNFFDGRIPVEIGTCLPGLRFLNISINSLDDSIPTSIGDMKLLQRLDLSDNNLSGVIPEKLAMGCSSLEFLELSNNRLQGQIFSTNFKLEKLNELYLAGNNLTGSIPNSLSNCLSLSKIDIGYNHLSGRIPRWMGNLSNLQIITMPNNHIEGPIPMEFCQLNIKVLDFSMNNISGTLPSCFSPSFINHVHLSKNRLQGSIPNGICKSTYLVTLDLSDNQLTGNIPNCIGNLSTLSYVVLKHNRLEGEIPNQFCLLDSLCFIDLSHNNFFGRIPNCLNVTGDLVYASMPFRLNTYIKTDGSIELTTKNRSDSYQGRILIYVSGIDLSSNKLTGEIPHEMGNFHKIIMMNLSHNSLTGSIPQSLSNLKEIESLDLSYNNLSGSIPFQFVKLYSLAYFNMSYNNLSGRPPPRTAQFASNFDENSYWGNPFLCGEPLSKNCSTPPNLPVKNGEDVGLMDMESFYVTFIISYIMVLLSIATVLRINPRWRQAWFYLIERGINSCFYFLVDNILSRPLHLW
ncbi:hypothetical protein DITRI_Ditri10aG0170100 [Diplodiscus trichospermus]